MWNLWEIYVKFIWNLCEIFVKFRWYLGEIYVKFMQLLAPYTGHFSLVFKAFHHFGAIVGSLLGEI